MKNANVAGYLDEIYHVGILYKRSPKLAGLPLILSSENSNSSGKKPPFRVVAFVGGMQTNARILLLSQHGWPPVFLSVGLVGADGDQLLMELIKKTTSLPNAANRNSFQGTIQRLRI